ncbi:MAG: hypothetical protein COZ80_06885 [Ignavibacteria bacterium CG_4_8_14_3_um_filter_37_9]|nr:hypothetical protein [Ignavibacteria bacterium]OIO22935.1 MAG: hypothetical protein AUJ54_02725 [Ignavibacteria bacterium CG1_02_37_35]PIP76940.1 MAG: hypothetical protein COW85_11615 [Ignavibacteria bacterium CG22_combo_CG10-13_8_21_14_all_37_15]PIS46359.1 MAG: hypothetical protein COT22_00470 [Ignavibacteria bacterium CG08_land_8_20_14_0_20_37_9]PIW99169.1 MAG: hypothetical protein COZ80_06885 [Ignavibacteria bacterium CG_4_8_14_3_um_filter_37_9]PIX93449.1 MAG: hypothetical protein COZ25_
MKNFVIFSIFIILFFSGCQKDNSLISSEQNNSTSLQKPVWVVAAEKQGLKLIALPQSSSISLEKKTSDTEFIEYDESGKLSIEKNYRSLNSGRVSVEASLSVQAYSMEQSSYLSMSFSGEFLCFEFGPSGTSFSTPALLNVEAEGLDYSTLTELKTAHLKYFDETKNKWVDTDADEIIVNAREGKFVCKNGKISHFSRYGFTN